MLLPTTLRLENAKPQPLLGNRISRRLSKKGYKRGILGQTHEKTLTLNRSLQFISVECQNQGFKEIFHIKGGFLPPFIHFLTRKVKINVNNVLKISFAQAQRCCVPP